MPFPQHGRSQNRARYASVICPHRSAAAPAVAIWLQGLVRSGQKCKTCPLAKHPARWRRAVDPSGPGYGSGARAQQISGQAQAERRKRSVPNPKKSGLTAKADRSGRQAIACLPARFQAMGHASRPVDKFIQLARSPSSIQLPPVAVPVASLRY